MIQNIFDHNFASFVEEINLCFLIYLKKFAGRKEKSEKKIKEIP